MSDVYFLQCQKLLRNQIIIFWRIKNPCKFRFFRRGEKWCEVLPLFFAVVKLCLKSGCPFCPFCAEKNTGVTSDGHLRAEEKLVRNPIFCFRKEKIRSKVHFFFSDEEKTGAKSDLFFHKENNRCEVRFLFFAEKKIVAKSFFFPLRRTWYEVRLSFSSGGNKLVRSPIFILAVKKKMFKVRFLFFIGEKKRAKSDCNFCAVEKIGAKSDFFFLREKNRFEVRLFFFRRRIKVRSRIVIFWQIQK